MKCQNPKQRRYFKTTETWGSLHTKSCHRNGFRLHHGMQKASAGRSYRLWGEKILCPAKLSIKCQGRNRIFLVICCQSVWEPRRKTGDLESRFNTGEIRIKGQKCCGQLCCGLGEQLVKEDPIGKVKVDGWVSGHGQMHQKKIHTAELEYWCLQIKQSTPRI